MLCGADHEQVICIKVVPGFMQLLKVLLVDGRFYNIKGMHFDARM